MRFLTHLPIVVHSAERLSRLLPEMAWSYGLVVLALWLVWLLPNPWALGVGAGVTLILAWRGLLLWLDVRTQKNARVVQRTLNAALAQARLNGAEVFSGVSGQDFHCEHVVIDEAGVFALSLVPPLPFSPRPKRLRCDGRSVQVDGREEGEFAVAAREQANGLQRYLQDILGMEIPVHAVLVRPDWFMDRLRLQADVTLTQPQSLGRCLAAGVIQLSPQLRDHLHAALLGTQLVRT